MYGVKYLGSFTELDPIRVLGDLALRMQQVRENGMIYKEYMQLGKNI